METSKISSEMQYEIALHTKSKNQLRKERRAEMLRNKPRILGLDKILAKRIASGLTQHDMAKRLGIPKAKIVRLESRLSRGIVPPGTILKRYINALGERMLVSYTDLI